MADPGPAEPDVERRRLNDRLRPAFIDWAEEDSRRTPWEAAVWDIAVSLSLAAECADMWITLLIR